MNFWKEALGTAVLATVGEKIFTKSKHLPEAFVTVFAATIIAKYIVNMDWNDNRPKFGPANFIGPDRKATKLVPAKPNNV